MNIKWLEKIKMPNKVIIEVISSIFIILFVYTAANKIYNFQIFQATLRKSPLIGDKYAYFMTWAVPISELIIATLLFFPKTKRAGLLSSGLIMLLFTGYIAYMVLYAPYLPCSCGGIIGYLSWHQHLWVNSILTVLAFGGVLLSFRSRNENIG